MDSVSLARPPRALVQASLNFYYLDTEEVQALRWYVPHAHPRSSQHSSHHLPQDYYELTTRVFDRLEIWDVDRCVHNDQYIIGRTTNLDGSPEYFMVSEIESAPLDQVVRGYRNALRDRPARVLTRVGFLACALVALGIPTSFGFDLYDGSTRVKLPMMCLAAFVVVLSGGTAILLYERSTSTPPYHYVMRA